MRKLHKLIISCLILFFSCASCAQDHQKIDVRKELGDRVRIMENASKIEVAKLKIVNVNEAQKQALKTDDRIAGYPVIGSLAVLTKEDALKVKEILLSNENYISLRTRCKNTTLTGVRFVDGKNRIEFALGMPCQQAIWAYPTKEDVKVWGANLRMDSAKYISSLVN